MADNESIKNALIGVLSPKGEGEPGRTVLLSGPWGSGKTYFWRNAVEKNIGRPVVYVSAFGVESAAQLKAKILSRIVIRASEEMASKAKPGSFFARAKGGVAPSSIRKAAQALSSLSDTAFRSVMSKFDLDPLEFSELFAPGIVLCFDDIERVSVKFGLDSFLGVVNLLSEHRKIDIVLICNEDHLMDNKEAAGKHYSMYREKVVSVRYAIAPDMNMILEGMVASGSEKVKEVSRKYGALVVAVMRAAGSVNARTLWRIVNFISMLEGLGVDDLAEDHVRLLVALAVESAEGKERKLDFYEFDSVSRAVLASAAEGDEKKVSEERGAFLKRFGLEGGYNFAPSLYALVYQGVTERAVLHAELNPPTHVPSEVELLLNAVRTGAWRIQSDREVFDLVKKLCSVASSTEGLNAEQVLTCVLYVRYLAGISGMVIDPNVIASIRERLVHLGEAGDASVGPHYSIMYSGLVEKGQDELRAYMDALGKYRNGDRISKFKQLISGGEFSSIAQEFRVDTETVRAFAEAGGVKMLVPHLASNADAVIDAAWSFGHNLATIKGIWSDARGSYSELEAALRGALELEGVDNMQKWRINEVLKHLKEKWGH